MKNWKDIRTETLNLGFEKTKAYEKNKQSYVDAYNWRQGLIASTIGGVMSQLNITCDGTGRLFDLRKTAEETGEEYIAVAQTGILDKEFRYTAGWTLTDNRFLRMPEDCEGEYVVNILAMPAKIDTASLDSTECKLPAKWANLVPYLMANRLYLDDDAAKAGYYWNLYTDMRDEILKKENAPVLSVTGGFDIDGWCL